MLRPFAHPVACCWMLLRVVAQSLKPVKLFSQQLPTFLLFRDRRSVAQQCWIHLHSSSNIVGAAHAHYAWFTKTYGLYPSHDALQVPTLLAQQCWELLRRFARSLSKRPYLRQIFTREYWDHAASVFAPRILARVVGGVVTRGVIWWRQPRERFELVTFYQSSSGSAIKKLQHSISNPAGWAG